MALRIWLPYVAGESGADVSTRYLGAGLRRAGHEAVLQPFPRLWQYFPAALSFTHPPPGTQIVLTNTWNGFAFRRPGTRMVTVERLFVLDPAYRPYRSFAQAVFHETLVRTYESLTVRTADAVVAVSRYSADALHRGLGGRRPRVIMNAVDTDFFRPAPGGKEPLTGRPVRLLFVGNLTARKGVDLLAPILSALGDGYELRYTSGLRTAGALDGLPNARPLGRLDQKEVREAYRGADLLLFPTRLEGLPRAVMESMACGTPVVTSDAASLPEAVEDAVNGRLCRQDRVEDFVAAVRDLTTREALLRALGEGARRTAEERFGLARMVAEYVDLFESLLQRGAR